MALNIQFFATLKNEGRTLDKSKADFSESPDDNATDAENLMAFEKQFNYIGPNRFLEGYPPRISDLKSDTYSEEPEVDEKSLYNENSGKNKPVGPDWTNIKSKCNTHMNEKCVLVVPCPKFEISGTNLEAMPHSNDIFRILS